jgi:hypothetical protein
MDWEVVAAVVAIADDPARSLTILGLKDFTDAPVVPLTAESAGR